MCIRDRSYRFEKSVIRSRVKGVYSEVNKIIDGTADDEIKTKYARVIDRIPIMKELADILVKNRVDRGAPEIDTSETKIITDENGVCIDVKPLSLIHILLVPVAVDELAVSGSAELVVVVVDTTPCCALVGGPVETYRIV